MIFRRRRRPAPLSCQELVELVTDYLEGALDEPTRRRFDEHLAGCDRCSAYLDQMRETIVMVGRLEKSDFPPTPGPNSWRPSRTGRLSGASPEVGEVPGARGAAVRTPGLLTSKGAAGVAQW